MEGECSPPGKPTEPSGLDQGRPDGWGAVMDELRCQQRVGATGEFDAE